MESENEGQNMSYEESEEQVVLLLGQLKNRLAENANTSKFLEVFDDEFLSCFIRGRKYDCDWAYQTIENYVSARTKKYGEIFRTLRPSTTASLSIGKYKILKNRDHLNRTIYVDRLNVSARKNRKKGNILIGILSAGGRGRSFISRMWNPNTHSMEDCSSAMTLVIDDLLRKGIPENGLVTIFDLDGYNLQHAKHLTPMILLQAINMFFKSMPLQYKELHVLNEIRLFSLMFKAVRPFLPSKIKNRLHFHGDDLSSLHKHISPTILPKSLGGVLSDEEGFDNELENRIRNRESFYQKFAEKI